ncbi:MAG: hypothetical protein GW913_16345 [Myxococcales bacterium]|nr:hypothetical protein [Myxococcales bacterium]
MLLRPPARILPLSAVALLLGGLVPTSTVLAQDHGPTLDLPPEASTAEASSAETPPSTETPNAATGPSTPSATSVGGYGELHFNAFMPDGGDTTTEIDLHRVVFFFGHEFGHGFRFYSELEVEHAFIEHGEGGEVKLEQAYIQWDMLDRALSLRAGMVLVPFGLTNRVHEPPSFHGVERPSVDSLIIPTTWSEGGIGLVGEPVEGLRYEAYLMGGLNAEHFTQGKGIRGGRQSVSHAVTDGPALAARVSLEPTLGVELGLSGYFGLTGPNTDAVSASVPVSAVALDGRATRAGLEARAELAYIHVGDTEALRADPMGTGPVSDVGSDIFGGYLELGYDVLHTMETGHALVPFVRAEWYDTTLSEDDPTFNGPSVFELTMGADYRPIPQIAFKVDVQFERPSDGNDENVVDLGIGWMF